jgi:hypothetical protein
MVGRRLTGVQYDRTKHRFSGRQNRKKPEENDADTRVLFEEFFDVSIEFVVIEEEEALCHPQERRCFPRLV